MLSKVVHDQIYELDLVRGQRPDGALFGRNAPGDPKSAPLTTSGRFGAVDSGLAKFLQ